MKVSRKILISSVLGAALWHALPASALVLGQQDDFEDGTTQNWLVGAPSPAPPVNIPTGGPDGVDDNYLLLTSLGGQGAGSRLTAINVGAQWSGDFVAAGIGGITMQVNNLGSTDLSLRLLFADPTVGPPLNVAFSTNAVSVTAGSGWFSIFFPIDVGDLTASLGDALSALTGATEMRLFHSTATAFPGEAIASQLGVDNIEAVAVTSVPEPTSFSLIALGLLGLAAARGTYWRVCAHSGRGQIRS